MAPRREHRSTYRRRNERARVLGFRNYYELRQTGGARAVTRQSRHVLDRLPETALETRRRSLEAVAQMRREGLSLSQAARQAGVSAEAVRFWAGGAITSSGRARPGDRLLRQMLIVSGGETLWIDVRGSRQASLVGAYWNAVARFLQTGDDRPLRRFAGKSVAGYELETDPDTLEGLALSGGLEFEDIYSLSGP
ncbi:MAG: hypothetical protein ACRDVL_02595 [Acidimicrobiia bacterium]